MNDLACTSLEERSSRFIAKCEEARTGSLSVRAATIATGLKLLADIEVFRLEKRMRALAVIARDRGLILEEHNGDMDLLQSK